jgi:ABC-2 type transport system permease protein
VNAGRIGLLIVANVKMLLRNRIALLFSLAFPFIFMVVFGLIAGNDSKADVDLVGVGPIAGAVRATNSLSVHDQPTAAIAIKHVRDGDRAAAVIVQGDRATLYYDNSDAIQSGIVRGIIQGLASGISQRATGEAPKVTVAQVSVNSTSLRYIDYLVPGLLAMALSQSAVFGVAGTLVSWRERGIFRRLRVTPLPLVEFIIARLVMQLLLAAIQVVVLLTVGRLLFGVHIIGNPLALIPVAAFGAMAFISLGFLVGSLARNEAAADAIANFVTLPMIFLSGVFFPVASAPAIVKAIGHVMPLTYLANGLRDVAVRGHSALYTMGDVLILALVTTILSVVSLRFFRWESR